MRPLEQPPKNSKFWPLSAQSFWTHFGNLLHLIFDAFSRNTETSCNRYNAKCLFLLLKAFHFGIKMLSKVMFFQDTFLDMFLLHFMLTFVWRKWCGDPPSKSNEVQNGNQNRPSAAKCHQFLRGRSVFLRCRKTLKQRQTPSGLDFSWSSLFCILQF